MPGTSRSAGRRRLFTVNAHNVELLFMLHFVHDDETVSVLNVDATDLRPGDYRTFAIAPARYRSYGDAESIEIPLGAMAHTLERPSVRAAARKMALGLMRRGPSNFAKFHSDDLLDEVLLHRPEPPSA